MSHDDWESVLRAAAEFQKLIPDAVLVGGTAAAIHVGHRFSQDADHIIPNFAERFHELVQFLENSDAWVTARIHQPKLLLGSFAGVETGLRQLIRARPLEVTTISSTYGVITLPTKAEMLRIKGWLIVFRNACRDFIDFVALADHLGTVESTTALRDFDLYYRDTYRPDSGREVSPLLQLLRQLAEPKPYDLDSLDLQNYRGIVPPWDSWLNIRQTCQKLAVALTTSTIAAT